MLYLSHCRILRKRLLLALSYRQPAKNEARYQALSHAVCMLTSRRGASACVDCAYVNDLKHHFILDEPDGLQAKEAARITSHGMAEWVALWESCVGSRKASDLKVCYLAGPEPSNDLNELISLGVLPSNIWAFESERRTFLSALDDLSDGPFSSLHLIKMKAESFFASIPVSFDIIYLDSCASLISGSHALRLVADLFRYQRLQSPGFLITNFCEPDFSDGLVRSQFASLITQRKIVSEIASAVSFETACANAFNSYDLYRKDVMANLRVGYSDLITMLVVSVATTVAPSLRAANSEIKRVYGLPADVSNETASLNNYLCKRRHESLLCLLSVDRWLPANIADGARDLRQLLLKELAGAQQQSVGVLDSLERLWAIKSSEVLPNGATCECLRGLTGCFAFHDKPSSELGVDLAFCQLTHPMFPSVQSIKRFEYVAKTKKMYLDVIPFDSCRYIFDLIPLPPQIKDAFEDREWQYLFRFALDGLVKQRLDYSTDYFYSGSVIADSVPGFEKKVFPDRNLVG